MFVKIEKISVLSLATMVCCLQALLGLILGVIAAAGSAINPGETGPMSLGAWSVLVFPLFNALFGFVVGTFLAGCYNVLSGFLGGVRVQLKEE